MAHLIVKRESAADRVFPGRIQVVDALRGVPSAGPIIFDNPTPEQIEAFGLAVPEPPEPEPKTMRRRNK